MGVQRVLHDPDFYSFGYIPRSGNPTIGNNMDEPGEEYTK